jgi:hypothetical protein
MQLWQLAQLCLLLEVVLLATIVITNARLEHGATLGLIFCILWVLAVCSRISRRERWQNVVPVSLGFLIAACSFAIQTPQTKLLFAAAALCLFSWQFAQHWIAVCTASPVSRATATILRRRWTLLLTLLAFIPLALVAVTFTTGSVLLPLLITGSFVAAHVCTIRPEKGPNKVAIVWEALASWCTYNSTEAYRPGLLRSPAGNVATRWSMTCICVVMVSSTWVLYSDPNTLWTSIGRFAVTNVALLVTSIGLPIVLVLPILVDSHKWRRRTVDAATWDQFILEISHSPDPVESASYYVGRVLADGSPVFVHRKIYTEHAHFLGDSGAGKTSLGLAPWLEQTISFGDSSIVLIDLKANSNEPLATLIAAAERHRRRMGRRIPIKHFSIQPHLSTYAFNPLTQGYWRDCDSYFKTDILCGAAGLLYGSEYGAGWYSAANAAVLHYAIKNCPAATSLAELAEQVNHALFNAKKRELHPELRAAGVHVQAILDRLGSFDALNATPASGYPEDVLREAIDLADLFVRPQILYFHLSSPLAAGSAPEIARLVAYSLLCAAAHVQRRNQVFLVIDEFQRMVASNLEYLLQLARSMGVGVILANQCMQDLGALIPTIEANCRFRQWFSVSSLDDRERLRSAAGETVESFVSFSRSDGPNGTSHSTNESEVVMSRISQNDIALVSDHPKHSFVFISRGLGYAQYGGLPFIVDSEFHITQTEYERRKTMTWPRPTPGAFIPRDHRKKTTPPPTLPARKPIEADIIGEFGFGGPPALPPSRKRLDRS